jgi:hypothetical protein
MCGVLHFIHLLYSEINFLMTFGTALVFYCKVHYLGYQEDNLMLRNVNGLYKIAIIYSIKFRERQNLPRIKNRHLRCPFASCGGNRSSNNTGLSDSNIVSIGHTSSAKLKHNQNSKTYTTGTEMTVTADNS